MKWMSWAISMALCWSAHAHAANGTGPSAASAGSSLPVAVSVVAGATVSVAAGHWTVEAVDLSGQAAVWVLRRGVDGVRLSLNVSQAGARALSVPVGATLTASAVVGGWLLSQGEQVVAYVPTDTRQVWLHHEELVR